MGDRQALYNKESKQKNQKKIAPTWRRILPDRLVLIQTHVFYADDFSARAPRPGRMMIANVVERRQSLVSS
jgi:hypothetical protein